MFDFFFFFSQSKKAVVPQEPIMFQVTGYYFMSKINIGFLFCFVFSEVVGGSCSSPEAFRITLSLEKI